MISKFDKGIFIASEIPINDIENSDNIKLLISEIRYNDIGNSADQYRKFGWGISEIRMDDMGKSTFYIINCIEVLEIVLLLPYTAFVI